LLKGVLILHTRGQPDKVLKAGDSFFNVRGAVHGLSADREEKAEPRYRHGFWI
jgi:quercetin dioxygenase-like cupin family protein